MVRNLEIEDVGIENLLNDIRKELKNIFGKELRSIYLYGSYAKKTNDSDSDLDVMVLVDMDQEEIKKMNEKILDLTVNLTTRYGIVLSIIENNYDYFHEWVDVIPFFKNIANEGIELHG